MKKFTVKQLSDLAGVSIRTLHHYDEIGLLKPAERSDSGYRHYGEKELLLLQQILLYRELGFPLQEIDAIVKSPDFDLITALEEQQLNLIQNRKRLDTLIKTVKTTIENLKTKKEMDYNSLYKGINPETAKEYINEASERWGKEAVEKSHARLLNMGSKNFGELLKNGERITSNLAELSDRPVLDPKVQELIAEHFEHTGKFFDVTPEIYKNLGQMYVDDPRFAVNYEKYRKGFAQYMCDAMRFFSENK